MPIPPPFDARLLRARTLTPGVRELTFERLDGRAMEFEPGQWVSAHLPLTSGDVDPVRRSYSVASPPNGSPSFEIAVTRVQGGAGSTWLHEVQPGAILQFIGPQGFFTRPLRGGPPSLLVATGTGITPVRSMVRAAVAAGANDPMWILLGVRHEEDVLYADELSALSRECPFVRFEVTLSRPRGASWAGRRGWVQTHVQGLWGELVASAAGSTPHAYVCGLERMVSSVRDLLRREMGLPRQQVHSERYD